MRILLTNDDGIFAPGLAALYREITKLGDVHIVAPDSVQSATGHGITLHTPLLTEQVTLEDGITGVAVDGRPADCVKLAVTKILPKRPQLVISGLNSGANVGINVLYSGTVAAAIEAGFLGLPAIALSLHLRREFAPDYAGAAKYGRQIIQQILKRGLKPGHVISVNIPGLPPGQAPTGVKVVRQCVRPWNDTYERRTDPKGRDYFWNTSVFTLRQTEDDSDVAALRERYITVTPLQFDLTEYALLKEWNKQPWPLASGSRRKPRPGKPQPRGSK
ncbi:MAG: 5'/3'-nucleotidase SurE [Planctomycetota bacterium]|nr:5'/3'-nucleotidase SurE [Planctomycetota bacterium]